MTLSMGCLCESISIIAVIVCLVRWNFSPWGWYIVGAIVVEQVLVSVLRESLRLYGEKSSISIFWLVVCTVAQLALLGISVASFFKS